MRQVLEARKRGIWFDVGNGRNGHIWWDVAERAMKQGFVPDTVSTDLKRHPELLEEADLVLAMTDTQIDMLLSIYPSAAAKPVHKITRRCRSDR